MKIKINGLIKYIGIVTIIYIIFVYLFSININPIYTGGMLFWVTYLLLAGIGVCTSVVLTFPSTIKSYVVEGKSYTYNRH
ncbi:MAG: hypothetical protein WC343_03075, partial [Bacilli bacterium]